MASNVAPPTTSEKVAPTLTQNPSASNPRSEGASGCGLARSFEQLDQLRKLVETEGACSLPGCSFDFNIFMPILQRAVIRGYVKLESARFVADGLRYGFRCGVDVARMRGRRIYRNYASAFEGAAKVSEAVLKRVQAHKTICLGEFDITRKDEIPFQVCAVFPMGAVRKKMEDALRPVDDHTRTLLNLYTNQEGLRYKMNTHKEVASLFFRYFTMAVKDVSDAFPLVPLHPSLWPFMLFQWWDVVAESEGRASAWSLFVHLFAGFGMAGLPGVWKILFADVLVGMARSEQKLTLPMPVFVDDAAIIGEDGAQVDYEGATLAAFLLFLGVLMKDIKTRYAATLQLYIGLWWNSVTRTLELEDSKRERYLLVLDAAASSPVLALREVQSLAGKLQRCALTFPPGSECIFASLYAFMRGLSLPWQKRRTTKGLRADIAWGASMLRANLGRGYFSYDMFTWGPPVWTDASKSRRYTGGGFVAATGDYLYFRYGTSAARKPIDELEGDVVVAMIDLIGGNHWRGFIIPVYVDNSAFQQSGKKGWSKAERLNDLLKQVFQFSVHWGCVFMFYWISTHDNVLADALSRPETPRSFLEHPQLREFVPHGVELKPHPSCGTIRLWGKGFSSSTDGDGPSRSGFPFSLTVSFARASIYTGLPSDAVARQVDQVMDNRLGVSSHRSVRAALAYWDAVRERHSWGRILITDDPTRGGKLATFVTYMAYETQLAYSSISNYVWALRTWMKFQRQSDPAYGVVEWQDFMDGIEVLTFVPAEPRKEVPGSWIAGSASHASKSVFWEVQAMLLQLLLLYTFARSESPLQKSWTGEGAFDPLKNLQVRDVKVETIAGKLAMGVRLKAIKQDPRMQRPEAQGEGDWVWIGESDGDTNIIIWLKLYFSFFSGVTRDPFSPFFVERDMRQGLTYAHGTKDVRELWARTPGVSPELAKSCGLHGLRVAGNNGTTKTLGKDIARVQGGWASERTQSRYDRQDMADVVRIPGAISASWAAREADFDFEAIQVPNADLASPSFVAPNHAPQVLPPVERHVSMAASRNIRSTQPFSRGRGCSPALPAVAGAACTEAGGSLIGGSHRCRPQRSRARRPALQTQGPVQPPPVVPPISVSQHRDPSSACLSLNRPVRSAYSAGAAEGRRSTS
jgi:hypothetical protein